MSEFDSTLRLFEAMDGLDDAFIQESMLPDTATLSPAIRGRGRREDNLLTRFARSGWAVAILCAVVSLSVLAAVVKLGIQAPTGDLRPPENNGPAGTSASDTLPSETDELPQLPAESDRVPTGTSSVDDAGLRYVSNGDGTCICMGFVNDRETAEVHIPDYSPDGDAVTEIYAYAFRNSLQLTAVTLPAGLRVYDRGTFPMEADIYHLYGNILYLGTEKNPYMVAVSTADNRPGATSLHPHTRLLADRALTYDSGSYFAMKWANAVPAYTDSEVFTLPSTLAYIGDYALLDVGRDITYNGYLVGWDALTAPDRAGLVRKIDGTPVRITCLDGTAESIPSEPQEIRLDGTAYAEDGILFGGYSSYHRGINEDYYAWLRDPESFTHAPEQFSPASVLGNRSRVLTLAELTSIRFTAPGTNASLLSFMEAYNADPAALYAGKTVVMVYVQESSLYAHSLESVTVSNGRIHVILSRKTGDWDVPAMEGSRFILVPVEDPDGDLLGADVSFTVRDE